MSALLTPDQNAVREGALRFATQAFPPARRRALMDAPNGRDRAAEQLAGSEGWLAIMVPEEHDGAGQGLFEAALIAEAFGRQLAPLPLGPAITALHMLAQGREENLTPQMLAGETLVVPVLTVADGPAARKALQATICASGGYELNGALKPVHAAGAADVYIVPAVLNGAIALFCVKCDQPGLHLATRRTIDGGSLGDLIFESCRIPQSALLAKDQAAADLQLGARTHLALLTAAELLGIIDTVISGAVEHLKTRQQFGRPLGAFQSLTFRVADAHMNASLARALIYETTKLAQTASSSALMTAQAALAKTAESAVAATRLYIQLLGAMGFTHEHDAGLYLKRALTLANAYATPPALRKAIASIALAQDAQAIRFRSETDSDRAFRHEVRQWINATLPERLRHLPTRPSFEDAQWWHRQLHQRGWIAPNWPIEYGGMDASVSEQIILAEELGASGAPEISGQALNHFGPILQIFGTPKQKTDHLPGMVSGDVIWCQGYSEPSSGSDLASLRTRAIRDGDDLIINGSKIWTTWAHYAHWMFALVRTNPDVKKQEGLTFVMIDMKTPGVTPRPINTITGEDEFAEVFLDNVRVPLSNVIGDIDGGWKVANAVLEKERLNGANPQKCAHILDKIKRAARHSGVLDDPVFRDRLISAEIDYVGLSATYAQIVKTAETDTRTNADFAFAKLIAAELLQELCELLVLAFGADGASLDPIEIDGERMFPGQTYLQARRATIYGGTVEIQRMLLARRVLGIV